ncbi:hypothetical protein PghCCS26_02430 [Paenibacillus glycanilyticus]|uniref:J domain-containing protein n=1 Tax=Paenibacillus glycanilyticus TaxID=126569 RepID=A0ABQ6NDU1_9BACL|nr:DnaJ domain-containing protein [Paenibacillus glycanilyticus]GMK43116.1 hypothetical protein PghCCS26_02430 [Paenibacillus glycanilyticus]
MDELKRAYETMGLPENASKEEVDKRYTTLMRQARARQRENPEGTDQADFEEVTRAYRYILDEDNRKANEAFNRQEYGKYKKMAGSAEKVDHFWRYYKFHVLGGIIALILVIVGINSYLDHRAEQERLAKLPPVDLSIMFLGEYYMSDSAGKQTEEADIEEALIKQFPEFKRFKVNFTYVPLDAKDQMDIASQQKAMVVLATERPDIYITDTAAFNWVGPQGAFMNLDSQTAITKLLKPEDSFKQKTEEDQSEHTYGVKISGSPIIGNIPMQAKDNYIASVREGSKNTEKALQFIEKFLETKQ